jgi:nuclear pore complex protein Nup133
VCAPCSRGHLLDADFLAFLPVGVTSDKYKDAAIIRPNHDLTSQLTSRKDRLSWLIQFINDNAVLGKISQRSRQRLATDAEKLYACHQLWLKMNEHLE